MTRRVSQVSTLRERSGSHAGRVDVESRSSRQVRAPGARPLLLQVFKRLPGRVMVAVEGTNRDNSEARRHARKERRNSRSLAAVMADLEQVRSESILRQGEHLDLRRRFRI